MECKRMNPDAREAAQLHHNQNPDPRRGDKTMPIRRSTVAAAALLLASPWCLAQDANLARNLAATCANCHGTNGNVRGKDVKPLAGVAAEKILAQIADFKSGAQPATIMHQISKGYSDEQLKLIAGYFAAQKPQ
jgi:cytochrome c553